MCDVEFIVIWDTRYSIISLVSAETITIKLKSVPYSLDSVSRSSTWLRYPHSLLYHDKRFMKVLLNPILALALSNLDLEQMCYLWSCDEVLSLSSILIQLRLECYGYVLILSFSANLS